MNHLMKIKALGNVASFLASKRALGVLSTNHALSRVLIPSTTNLSSRLFSVSQSLGDFDSRRQQTTSPTRYQVKEDDDQDDLDRFQSKSRSNFRDDDFEDRPERSDRFSRGPSNNRFDGGNKRFGSPRGGSSYGNSSPMRSKMDPRKMLEMHEEDLADAVPVDASGAEMNFKSTDHTSFEKYDLPEELVQRLNELGYKSPFEIQDKTLPHILAGKDLVGKAFTGSGKTLAFTLPIVAHLMRDKKVERNPRCVIVAPTRELCLQLHKSIQDLNRSIRCLAVYGGSSIEPQIDQLRRRGCDVVVATPGRLRALYQSKDFTTEDVEMVCLDEADQLLKPEFIEQFEYLMEQSADKKKQLLMFSATMNKTLNTVIRTYTKDPVMIDLTEGKSAKMPANIDHFIARVPFNSKITAIKSLMNKFDSKSCIVFTNTKKLASEVVSGLRSDTRCGELHGNMSQSSRTRIIEDFRSGKLKCVVATDVAARGIDVAGCNLVIQIGAPANGMDYYVHRSGRCGRGGRVGHSVILDCLKEQSENMPDFCRSLSRLVKLKLIEMPQLESDPRINRYSSSSSFGGSDYGERRYAKPYASFKSKGSYRFDD